MIKEKKAVISYSYRQNIKRTDAKDKIRASKNDYIIEVDSGLSLNQCLFFNQSVDFY